MTEPALLPKYICTGCLEKITEFHAYCREILATQQHFIDNLVKQEPADAVELSEAIAIPLPPVVVEEKVDEFIEAIISQPIDHDESEAIEKATSGDDSDTSSTSDEMFNHSMDDFTDDFIDEPAIKVEQVDEEPMEVEQIGTEQIDSVTIDPDAGAWHFEDLDEVTNDDEPDDATIAAVIAKHFNPTCHICPTKLTTLDEAKDHYRSRHNVKKGFLKCCDMKLSSRPFVIDHIRWHLDPMAFR